MPQKPQTRSTASASEAKQRYLPMSCSTQAGTWNALLAGMSWFEQRQDDADRQHEQHDEAQVAAHALPEEARDHSTDRPFSANRPRGRRWMNRMMNTSTRILPSTAPA